VIRRVAVIGGGCLIVMLLVAYFSGIRFTIQSSNSMPKGLYLVISTHRPLQRTLTKTPVVEFPKRSIEPSPEFAFAGKEPGSTERKTGVNTPVNEDLSTALTPLFSAQVEFPRGSVVVFWPPSKIMPFLKTRHWISKPDWMMKKLMGVPGDAICIKGNTVWINGFSVGKVFEEDRQHRALPKLSFCRTLKKEEYFAMSTYAEHSFDSRYFGPVLSSSIIGNAYPVWTYSDTSFVGDPR
jgi:conjugative transfer signal peptidase TraF